MVWLNRQTKRMNTVHVSVTLLVFCVLFCFFAQLLANCGAPAPCRYTIYWLNNGLRQCHCHSKNFFCLFTSFFFALYEAQLAIIITHYRSQICNSLVQAMHTRLLHIEIGSFRSHMAKAYEILHRWFFVRFISHLFRLIRVPLTLCVSFFCFELFGWALLWSFSRWRFFV